MFKKNQYLRVRKNQETEIPIDQEKTSPTVSEIPDIQNSKNDEILSVTSTEKPKSSERKVCDNMILTESQLKGIKECLWITPKPASSFEEYFASIPKASFL